MPSPPRLATPPMPPPRTVPWARSWKLKSPRSAFSSPMRSQVCRIEDSTAPIVAPCTTCAPTFHFRDLIIEGSNTCPSLGIRVPCLISGLMSRADVRSSPPDVSSWTPSALKYSCFTKLLPTAQIASVTPNVIKPPTVLTGSKAWGPTFAKAAVLPA